MSSTITVIAGGQYIEYFYEDGSRIRIRMPDQIELTEGIDDSGSESSFMAFSCAKCGAGPRALFDLDQCSFFLEHIEECLGLEPLINEEGTVTTMRYIPVQ